LHCLQSLGLYTSVKKSSKNRLAPTAWDSTRLQSRGRKIEKYATKVNSHIVSLVDLSLTFPTICITAS